MTEITLLATIKLKQVVFLLNNQRIETFINDKFIYLLNC